MSAQCPTMGKTSQYNCYMLTHRLQTIVDSGTPIHIVFDHLFVSNTRDDHTPVTGFSGNASRATHRGDMTARVRTDNNTYINLVDVNSTLVVPDCVRRLYSVRQATHKGYKVLLDSHKPGLWVCEHFIPFVNDPDTNLWLLPLFPPTSKDNGIYPIPSYNAAALPKPAIDIPDELQSLRQQWLMEHHRLGHPSQKRQAALEVDGQTKPKVPKLTCPTCLASKARKSNRPSASTKEDRSTVPWEDIHSDLSGKNPHNPHEGTNTLWSSYAPTRAPNTSNSLPTRTTSSMRTVAWSSSWELTQRHSGPTKVPNI